MIPIAAWTLLLLALGIVFFARGRKREHGKPLPGPPGEYYTCVAQYNASNHICRDPNPREPPSNSAVPFLAQIQGMVR